MRNITLHIAFVKVALHNLHRFASRYTTNRLHSSFAQNAEPEKQSTAAKALHQPADLRSVRVTGTQATALLTAR